MGKRAEIFGVLPICMGSSLRFFGKCAILDLIVPERMRNMKGIRILAAAGALLMTESLWSCGLLPAEEEELAPPLAAPAAVSYTTTKVERGDIVDSINVSGTFVSTRSYELSFEKRAGYLSEITVKAGDTVEEGQMLARLDTDSLKKDEKRQELLVERAKIALDAAKASENATQSSIRLAEIDYELQKLQLDEIRTELSKQTIYAPADGVVAYLSRQSIGDYVSARSTLIRLVDPEALQVEYSGDKSASFDLGQEVFVTFDKKEYKGTVVMTPSSAPYEKQGEGKSAVRIEITDPLPEEELLGKSVSVELILQKREDVILVPRNVVTMYSGESYVQVLEDGIKKERVIETGIKNAAYIEVINGLSEGEEVIIK